MFECIPFPHPIYPLVRLIKAIPLRQRSQTMQHISPFFIRFYPQTIEPIQRRPQSEPPIAKFERRIDRCLRIGILRYDIHRRSQDITTCRRIEVSVIGHKIGRLDHDILPLEQRLFRRIQPVVQLGKIDRMGLLPNQQGVDRMRPLAVEVRRTLRPTRSAIALLGRPMFRCRQKIGIDLEASFRQRPTVPQPVMYQMPPYHFEMKPSVPAVVDQTALLRRQCPGGIHPHQVL